MFARRRKMKQFCEARLVRFAGGTIPIGLDPFWMLHAQSVVDLLLELRVRTDFLRAARRCLHFHPRRYRRFSDAGDCTSVGISNTTDEVNCTPSFEIDETVNRLGHDDSPGRSPSLREFRRTENSIHDLYQVSL